MEAHTQRPRLGITMGDPGGIGPEVVARAIEAFGGEIRAVVYGDGKVLDEACRMIGVELLSTRAEVELIEVGQAGSEHEPTAAGGEFSFACVEMAIEDAKREGDDPRRIDAIVTGPISKKAWAMAGHDEFPGHTELLAERFDAPNHAMMFVSPKLRVILATTHIGLAEVPGALSAELIERVIQLGARACGDLGVRDPRVAVCGLNPHAGEDGLFGDEEARIIQPAIEAACNAGDRVTGPHPADTVFNRAVRGEFDLVVAMYHDQGLIPVKLLGWEEAVNVTVGLPVVRTSPDHGTAFDIAGQGKADARSMVAAMRLATDLVQSHRGES